MKTLNDLIDLMNQVQKNELTKSYLIKASVSFNTAYYPKDDKKLITFNYSLLTEKTKDDKVRFLFNPEKVTENQIQKMYYTILCDCRIS